MTRVLPTILVLVAFVTQGLGGAFVAVRHASAQMACCANDASSEFENLCHTQGRSPAVSPAATICCETFCGEGASGSQFETLTQIFTPALSARVVRAEPFGLCPGVSAFTSTVASLLRRHAPALFLQQSAFLI
jgi:hypothetical protein